MVEGIFTACFTLFALIGTSWGQTCESVHSTVVHCLDDGDFQISCPANHWLLIKDTVYFISEGDSCPPTDDSTACADPGEVTEIEDCHKSRTGCDVTIEERTASSCPGTHHYVWVKYQCEPLQNTGGDAYALGMCNSATSFEGTLIHMDSDPLALAGNYVRDLHDCNCQITIPAGSDIYMRVPIFLKVPSQNTANACNQKIVLYDEIGSYEFCDTMSYNISCSDSDRTFRVSYLTESTSVKVIFLLQVFVPYTSSGFSIDCGIPYDELITTPFPELTTETVTTEEPFVATNSSIPAAGSASSSSEESSWKLPIIIGMACLSFLIMVIVILILCIRFRGESEDNKDTLSDTGSDSKSNFTFITEVYIDGNQKSKLVMGKNPANPRPLQM